MTYLLSKTAYFDPDMFQWLTDKLSNSWERLKEDYQEAQTTLRHEEDSKREASDKTNQMLISLNRSIEDAGNSGYFEVDEIRRLVLDGRRCFHNQHRGQENNANVLNREIVTHIDLIRSGNSEGGLLSNFNELSRNLFNISIRNQPVSALETRIYHIDVLLPHAEDEMRNELEKQKLGLKVKLAGFRHEDSRVHYVKFFGPSRDSNLGRYKLHKGYLSTNPGARSIVKDGVLWVRSDRQVFEILSANGLVEGNYINNQSTINRNRELGKRLASSLVFIGMIYQRRLDLFLDISEWNIVKLCFETYFQSNRNYSWDERAETGYELKNYDQLLNIEWIVGQFRNQDFQLRLRTPEAIQLWRDHNSELCQNNNNLTLIVG
jgi:hypothetical protein